MFRSVETADIALCVLSLPDVLQGEEQLRVQIPPTLASMITPETVFLFNKSDLVPVPIPQDGIRQSINAHAWVASMNTGAGTKELLEGMGQLLQDR